MTMPLLLQLCPFSPALEAKLSETFEICRFFELADQSAWLAANAERVRAVATGGHIGTPTPLMEQLPNLGIVAINGVGFDKVDLNVARARGVRVTTTPNVLSDDVADLAVGLTIGLLRGIPASDRHVREGRWLQGERSLARKVTGCRFGIVGLGQIGQAVAKRLAAFGPVNYFDQSELALPYTFVPDLETLAAQSDVLVVSISANAHTYGLIGKAVLNALGPKGYLVNVARGSVVNELALIEALQGGRIAGAALDVFADEPNVPQALIELPNVVLTPHIASATVETRENMAQLVVDNLRAFVASEPLPSALV
jgi:lactate dehydrogenase-like 2-hydroxyacid dehydrogenase